MSGSGVFVAAPGPFVLGQRNSAWVLLAGLSGSAAQLCMTRAYQMAPAAPVRPANGTGLNGSDPIPYNQRPSTFFSILHIMRPFPKAAALILLCLLVSGCAGLAQRFNNLKEPRVSLAGLALKRMDFFKPSFLVRLNVENPNDVAVNIDGADVALALNGQPVAKGVSRSPLSLAKLGSSSMDVEVSADTLGVLQQILLLQNRQSLDYQVSGRLTVLDWLGPLGQVPFDFQGVVDRDDLLKQAQSLGGTRRAHPAD